MKIVLFKNGEKIKISDSDANVILLGLNKYQESVNHFESFRNDEKSPIYLGVNTREIAAIYSPENVL
jgi:hypothetical protein